MRSRTCRADSKSKSPVGSSARTTPGSETIARAIAGSPGLLIVDGVLEEYDLKEKEDSSEAPEEDIEIDGTKTHATEWG